MIQIKSFKNPIFLFFIFTAFLLSFTLKDKANTDFRAYYLSAQRLVAKTFNIQLTDSVHIAHRPQIFPEDSLYNNDELTPYKYVPVIAYIFAPLVIFDYYTAKKIWYFSIQFFLFLSFYFLLSLLKFEKNNKHLLFFITYFFLFRFILYDLKNLQINSIITFCLCGFFYFKEKKENLACFLLAFGIGVKIFSVFLLIYLIVEKEWKLLGKTILFGILLILFPIISYTNFSELFQEYLNYFQFMSNGQHAFPASPSYIHPSIDSLLVRILMSRPYFSNFSIGIFEFSPVMTFILILVIKFILLITIIYHHRKYKHLKLFWWSVYIWFTIIINPLAWKHAYVGCLPLAILGVQEFLNHPLRSKTNILFFISLALMSFTSKIFLGNYQKIVAGISPVLLGSLILIIFYLKQQIQLNSK